MKSIWIFLTIIVVLAIIYGAIILNESQQYAYWRCIQKNKKLAEGSKCGNCIRGQEASFIGAIKNGDCVPNSVSANGPYR